MPATRKQLVDLHRALKEAWGKFPVARKAGRRVFMDWPGDLGDAGERAACWDAMTRAALLAHMLEQQSHAVNLPAPVPAPLEEPCRSRD